MLDRHGKSHDHDFVKVFTLFTQVLGDFILNLVILTDPNRDDLAITSVVIFAVVSATVIFVNSLDLARDVYINKYNKEKWLLTTSKTLVILCVLCYIIGDNLPDILTEYSVELDCDTQCQEHALISGVFFLFISLATFNFIPSIFRKINGIINENYNHHYIREDKYKDYQLQYFIMRMIALILDFDTIYTGVWVYAFVDVQNCDTDDIIGSTATIFAGWVTWTIYAVVYAYLSQ